MREIKFRALRLDTKEWVYGSLIFYRNGTVTIIGNIHERAYRALPESIGQYTGLKDKNGKEIYEGDIVEINSSPYIVEWDNKNGKWLYSKPKGINFSYMSYAHYNQDFGDKKYKVEVIGNIYENPELLKN